VLEWAPGLAADRASDPQPAWAHRARIKPNLDAPVVAFGFPGGNKGFGLSYALRRDRRRRDSVRFGHKIVTDGICPSLSESLVVRIATDFIGMTGDRYRRQRVLP
jgi:hypothetical protein